MVKKSVFTKIIEESYEFLKDDIIMVHGYACMFGDMCRDTVMRHSDYLNKSEMKIVAKYRDKADFICDKFDELYKFLIKDYPNPMDKSR